MSRRLLKGSMNLLLAATVVVGGALPPAVRHAHEGGGDISHRHDAFHSHDVPSIDSQRRAPTHRHAAVVSTSLADRTSHLHVTWLGCHLTLPDSKPPLKGGKDHLTPELVFLRDGREMLSAAQAGPRTDRPLIVCAQEAAPDVSPFCPAAARSSHPLTTSLLCDRARHERSGVQLI
jgi:hypothetical protein